MHKLTADTAKRARESVGASQIEMAQAVGINRTYYSLFEAGRYVLDDDEHERLMDALTERGYAKEAGPAGNAGEDPPAESSAERAGAPAPATDLPREQLILARAKAALAAVADAVPRGLQSIRVAHAVEAASNSLAGLDYVDLLALATESKIETSGLISAGEFSKLDLDGMQQWESRAAGVLICSSLYGKAWANACFDRLKDAEADLRATLDGQQLQYRERGFLDIVFGDGDEHCPNRRADLAPYFVRAAALRKAPTIAAGEPSPPPKVAGFGFFGDESDKGPSPSERKPRKGSKAA